MATLGIDLGGTNIRAAVLSEGVLGEIHSLPVNKNNGRDGVLEQIVRLIGQFNNDQIEGIGIGVPSYVDIDKGIVYDTTNLPGWDEVPLKAIIEGKFQINVNVNNDANCFALGEKFYGKGKPFTSMVGITLGTGVGAGIIINGKLYTGQNCGAGEIGALPYRDRDYEFYAGGSFFTAFQTTTAREVFEMAEQGDTKALEIFNAYGHHLGALIKLVLQTYDPQAIILGGSIANAWKYFHESMYTSIHLTPFKQFIKNLKIEVSSLDNAGIYGAAHLGSKEY